MTPKERAVYIWDKWHGERSFLTVVANAIREAIAEEREACAKVAENTDVELFPENDWHDGAQEASKIIAARIRARSHQSPVEEK